jgi:GT2 family glycosyltransferase
VKGDSRLGGEETDLQQRIRGVGGRILYVHNARVKHLIVEDKLRFSFLLKQEFERGMSMNRLCRRLSWRAASVETFGSAAQAVAALATGHLSQAFLRFSRVSWHFGHLVDSIRRNGVREPFAASASGASQR